MQPPLDHHPPPFDHRPPSFGLTPPPHALSLMAADDAARARVLALSQRFGWPVATAVEHERAQLVASAERLELHLPGARGGKTFAVDFVSGPLGYERRAGHFGPLHRAVGLHGGVRPSVLDATAGLGRDAFRLAWAGCEVIAIERSPVLVALLEDGLARAIQVSEIRERVMGRLKVLHGDAREVLRSLAQRGAPGAGGMATPPPPIFPLQPPDVVYLDPMFPPKKKSALVKQEMRLLRQLVGDDRDASELFEGALQAAGKRVVVKRMHDSPPLAPNPNHTCGDKTTRYDVYMTLPERATPAR